MDPMSRSGPACWGTIGRGPQWSFGWTETRICARLGRTASEKVATNHLPPLFRCGFFVRIRFFVRILGYSLLFLRSIRGSSRRTKTFSLRTIPLTYWSQGRMLEQSKRAYAGRLLDHPLHPALDSLRIPGARRDLFAGGGGRRTDRAVSSRPVYHE
jgi:hypothetical protein